MKNIRSALAALAMAVGVYFGEFVGIVWAANIAVFVAWFFITASFICFFAPPEDLFTDKPAAWWRLYVDAALVLLFAASGWTFTAIGWTCAAVGLYVKRDIYMDKKEAQP